MTDRNVLLHKKVRIEMGSHSKYEGSIEFMDDIGLMFMPNDLYLNPCYITWHYIVRIHIIDNEH